MKLVIHRCNTAEAVDTAANVAAREGRPVLLELDVRKGPSDEALVVRHLPRPPWARRPDPTLAELLERIARLSRTCPIAGVMLDVKVRGIVDRVLDAAEKVLEPLGISVWVASHRTEVLADAKKRGYTTVRGMPLPFVVTAKQRRHADYLALQAIHLCFGPATYPLPVLVWSPTPWSLLLRRRLFHFIANSGVAGVLTHHPRQVLPLIGVVAERIATPKEEVAK